MNLDYQKPRDEAMEKIESYIIENQLKPNDKLPSERNMCEMWNVNRSTLRSAIKQLVLEGIIYNKNGSGTYVARGKLIRNLQDAEGFYHTAQKENRQVTTKVIQWEFCEATKNTGQKMRLPLGHKLFCLTRLRYLDETPVLFETVYLDAERFPGIEKYDFSILSLYMILKDHYHVNISSGEEKLSIAYCDEKEACYLDIAEGDPVIYQSGVTADDQDVIFEYFKDITRSEYIRFASELARR